jgi:hypothetical protein
LIKNGEIAQGTEVTEFEHNLKYVVRDGQLERRYVHRVYDKKAPVYVRDTVLDEYEYSSSNRMSPRHLAFYEWIKASSIGRKNYDATRLWFRHTNGKIDSVLTTLDNNGLLTYIDDDGTIHAHVK